VREESPPLSAVLRRSIVLAAALATLLFATPLAVAVNGLYRTQAFTDLGRKAETLRTALSDQSGNNDAADRLAAMAEIRQPQGTELGVYSADGRLLRGEGPVQGETLVTQVGRTGIEDDGLISGHLVVVVPVPVAGANRYLVRAARHDSEVRTRTYASWALMAALFALILALVAWLAKARAGRIARPLQELAEAADHLGQGDFSVRATRSGVAEVDQVSSNLERTAQRLGRMLERERRFSSDASHQMRTPLTAVRVGLESALLTPGADVRAAAVDALVGLDRLEQTVEDLLALARDTTGPAAQTDVVAVVRQAVGHWGTLLAERQRWVELAADPEVSLAAVSTPALRTVLDVLLGNALTHGAGTVGVQVHDVQNAVLVEIIDSGAGIVGDPSTIFRRRSPQARGTGIGLALARSLIEADGGRLELTRVKPATFAVLLPVVRPVPEPAQPPGPEAGEATGPRGGPTERLSAPGRRIGSRTRAG
jgi:signal transduction histidine kinase